MAGASGGEPADWRLRRVVVASGNVHKVRELEAMLREARPGLEVVGARAPGTPWPPPPDVDETEPTFAGNAILKARAIARWLQLHDAARDTAVLADDSGVAVDALDGAPGVHSARFAGPDADDRANNLRLVEELRARGRDRSPAAYHCVLALVRADGAAWTDAPHEGAADVRLFAGTWQAEVRTEARGTGGFGYDPHCWIDGGARTVAELDAAHKHALSHRGQALRTLLEWLRAAAV